MLCDSGRDTERRTSVGGLLAETRVSWLSSMNVCGVWTQLCALARVHVLLVLTINFCAVQMLMRASVFFFVLFHLHFDSKGL